MATNKDGKKEWVPQNRGRRDMDGGNRKKGYNGKKESSF